MKSIGNGLLSTFAQLWRHLPGSCLICTQSCNRDYSLCRYCETGLPFISIHCLGCGEEHPRTALFEGRCGRCQANPPPFSRCVPIFRYAAPVDRLISGFKYRQQFAAGFALGNIMAQRLERELAGRPAPQLLLPVPLHGKRLRQRGFNQAWEICKLVSRRLAIPAGPSLMVKRQHTEPQSELPTAARRRHNLRGAFGPAPHLAQKNVTHIAIIDDVVTTMSTVSELSRVLTALGIRRIEVWCLARAQR